MKITAMPSAMSGVLARLVPSSRRRRPSRSGSPAAARSLAAILRTCRQHLARRSRPWRRRRQIWIWRCRLRRSIWRSESDGLNSRHLAQRHHARRGVGVERVARDVDLVEVGDAGALVARQAQQDLVVLAVGTLPLARPARRRSARAWWRRSAAIDTPMSLASSRFTTMSSAGLVGLKLLSTSTVPLTALIFAITSCEMRSSSWTSGPMHEDADRAVPADVDLEARDALQALADRVVDLLLRARALLLGAPAGGSNHAGVAPDALGDALDLGELAQRRLDLLGLGGGVGERGADRRLDAQAGPALVGLRHELALRAADRAAPGEEASTSREADGAASAIARAPVQLAVAEGPAQRPVVARVQPVHAALLRARAPTPPARAASSAEGGSRHTEESIGSSVNETKSDTSTATTTVMPNW